MVCNNLNELNSLLNVFFSFLFSINERLSRFTGAFLVNTSSSQLLDDCAVKQLLIDGTLAGCALDGVEGPQWMEAWVCNFFHGYIN